MTKLDERAASLDRLLRRVPVTLGDAGLSLPPDVVQALVPRDEVTLLTGHGGSGKSLMAMILAAHVACGRPWAGFEVMQCRALVLTIEDSEAVVRVRLRRIASRYALPVELIERNIVILDGSQADASLAFEVMQDGVRRIEPGIAFAELRETAAGFGLVIIDNASDAFDGSENDRRQVRTFMRRMLARLAVEVGAGVLLLAHVDKVAARHGGNDNTYSGSTAWHNSARSRLALIEAEGQHMLRQEKRQHGRAAEPVRLAWSDDGVLMPCGGDLGARLAERTMQTDADAVALLACMKSAEDAGLTLHTGRVGPANTLASLAARADFPQQFTKGGKIRFWQALDLLAARGKIVRETYRNARRHQSERWTTRADRRADAPQDAPESARASPPHTPPAKGAHGGGRAPSPVSVETQTRAKARKPAQQCSADEYRQAREGGQ